MRSLNINPENIATKNTFQLVLIALLAASLNVLFVYQNPDNLFDNTQYDVVLAQNSFIFGDDERVNKSVVVVALDHKTLEQLSDYPRVMMAPKWAELIEILMSANARMVGFDIVFAYPDDKFKNGWEQSFLSSLTKYTDRIVFARSETTMPKPRFQAAFRFQPADEYLGAIEVSSDNDGIVRTMYSSIKSLGTGDQKKNIPTLYSVITKKSGVVDIPNSVRLAPQTKLSRTPTYSMSDILECNDKGKLNWLRQQLSGKIVLIGSTLKGEDDGITLDRFFPGNKSLLAKTSTVTQSSNCVVHSSPSNFPNTKRVPSVYLHATAIDQIIDDRLISVVSVGWKLAVAAILGALVAVMTMLYGGLIPLFSIMFIATLMHACTSFLMANSIWYASAYYAVLLFLTGLFTYVFKYLVVERKRRVIQTAFGLFLSEYLVDRLISENKRPTLGGEKRQITVMFADLSGYTELSGKISPTELMTVTNEYLEIMAQEIERSGGYIDKFIGDEIMAFWGAPADDRHHAKHAIETSIRIINLLEAKQAQDKKNNKPSFGIKIALNSGEAIIGNIGTKNRMNYSAVGQTINIAARFEEYASQNGKRFVIGQSTYLSSGKFPGCIFTENVNIRGVEKPLKIYSIKGLE